MRVNLIFNYEKSCLNLMPQTMRKIFSYLRLVPRAYRLILLHIQLHVHGVVYGKKLRGRICTIKNKGRIELANSVSLNSYPEGELFKTGLLTHYKSSLIRIGDNASLNGTVIHSNNSVVIGNDCLFGPGVVILDNDSHNTSIDPELRWHGKADECPVVIGNNVWIGMHSIIMKGVHIGDNSIVAAGSIVTKDIPPNQLFGGNPATFIKALDK